MCKIILLNILLIIVSCNSTADPKIGGYLKEELPQDFTYKVVEDKSNNVLEKNEVKVILSKKITEGQIATIASELYESKPKQRRFYIFYSIKGIENNPMAWAISHFDPDLKIEIMGSTAKQDTKTVDFSDIPGTIVGKWRNEKSLSGASLILYKTKKGQLMMRINFKNGEKMDSEIEQSEFKKLIRYDDGNHHGEYYLVEVNGNLGMYGKEGKYDEATSLEL